MGRMATHAAAGRHLTYAAAQAMERDEQARASSAPSTKPGAGLAAAMCKLFASDVAIWVSQEECYFTVAGVLGGRPDCSLHRGRAGAADIRGREADPGTESDCATIALGRELVDIITLMRNTDSAPLGR